MNIHNLPPAMTVTDDVICRIKKMIEEWEKINELLTPKKTSPKPTSSQNVYTILTDVNE